MIKINGCQITFFVLSSLRRAVKVEYNTEFEVKYGVAKTRTSALAVGISYNLT